MKVGILGSGARENSICWSLKKSKLIEKIYCFPGNAGTEKLAQNINIDLDDFEDIKNFILKNEIDLIIVGPEKPLVDGIVDYLESYKIKVFGPNKIASQLEGSKSFTKKLCEKYDIPTAKFGIFENKISALTFLKNCNYPIVIKADGLASGKGVYINKNIDEASFAVEEIFNGKFGITKYLLIEEFLEGEEMSFFIISDGLTFKNFNSAQDHKRVLEGDLGKNTGGMGAYSPSRLINNDLEKKIIDRIIKPTIKGLKDLNTEFKGFLYAGLMIKNNEPYLIEYNVRMGDPECQTILPKLKTDLLEIILACCDQRLNEIEVKWDSQKSLCIVLCANGYPEKYQKDVEIKNLKKIILSDRDFCFHAGTKSKENRIYSYGGRVLSFVSLSDNFLDCRNKIVENLKILNWKHGFYRKDIGYKVIDK